MNKNIVFLVLAVSLSNSSFGQYPFLRAPNPLEPLFESPKSLSETNLIGKVSFVGEPKNIDKIIEAKKNDGRITFPFARYDRKGNIIEFLARDGYRVSFYKYDDKGNQEEYRVSPEGKIVDFMTYKYDDKGNCVERNPHWSSYYTFKYDDKRNCIEENEYDYEGDQHLMNTCTYKYDDKGNCIEAEFRSAKINYKYDDKGNCIEVMTFRKLQNRGSYGNPYKYELSGSRSFKYDEKGNIVESTDYNAIPSYDGDERLIPAIVNFKRKYQYDNIGNWIKCFEYRDFIIISTEERVIEYY